MSSIDHLLSVVGAYCAATGHTESTVSTRFLGAGGRIKQIRGGSDMGSQRLARVIATFSAEWPDGAPWPADVPRPAAVDPQMREAR